MPFAKVSFFDAIGANKRNSLLLLLGVGILFMAVVAAFSYLFDLGDLGFMLGFIFLIGYGVVGYFAGASVILGMSGAQPIQREQHPYIFNVVEGLSIAAGIPMPRLYLVPDPSPNAFAVGRDPKHASLAVTSGLLERLNRQELEGVLAHEVSHIANYDSRFIYLAIIFVGAIGLLSNIAWRSFRFGTLGGGRGGRRGGGAGVVALIAVILIVLGPIFSELLKLAISRQREYLADANGAKLTRYPEGLARALEKISAANLPVAAANDTTASLYFSNPIPNKIASLFATHPPIEERIKRLRGM